MDAARGVCKLCGRSTSATSSTYTAVSFFTQEEIDEFPEFRFSISPNFIFDPSTEGYTGSEVLTFGVGLTADPFVEQVRSKQK